jgi:ribosomal protein L28
MKYRIETQKPNIKKKTLKSEILNQEFKLWISMKARKCIMKAGSLDNYLLNTKPKDISSKFGLYIRELLIQKQKNPETFKLNYIPGTSQASKTRKTQTWEYR